jgi:TonB family protein
MKNILLLLPILLLSECKAPEWPTSKYITKYNYEEVNGDFCSNPQELENCGTNLQLAKYPNGLAGIYSLVRENITYPKEALNNNITGTVLLSYVVEPDGNVDEIKVIKGINPLLDKEAVRVIQCMGRWIPGICNGEFIRVQYRLPIKFSIK